MKIDGPLLTLDLGDVPARARELEELAFDGIFAFEGPREPFLRLTLAAEHTERVTLMSAVAIALARNPMIVAQLADDLQSFSRGRFVLGLGSQVKAHVERRFSAPWSRPAPRMREFVQALRAIWACWNEGEPLRFEGEFYRHTLMPPLFNPGPNAFGPPPVFLAGVGPAMTEVAGEVGDGMLVHPFHSSRSLEQITLPALDRGLATSGRTRASFQIAVQVLVVTGATEEDHRSARELTRQQIAFYGSTPAYRPVLASEGRGELQPELHALTRAGRWQDLGTAIDDELLERIAVCGPPESIAGKLNARYGSFAARVALASPYSMDAKILRTLIQGVRG